MPEDALLEAAPATAPETAALAAAPAVAGRLAAAGGGLRGAAILSVGAALPERVVSNDEVAARIGKTDEWIYTRTGIRARRHAGPDDSLTAIAAQASHAALERAGVAADALDLVVVGTLTADDRMPNAAAALAHQLGAERAATVEVNAACTGFLTALSVATAQVEAGRARHALVVGADFISRITDLDCKQTGMLFADGAGAVVVGATPPGAGRVGPVLLRADASAPEHLYLARTPGATIEMDGHETFKHAVNRMAEITRDVVAAAGLTLADVDLFAYHQANARIVKAVGERLSLQEDRVIDCIEQIGNMSAASVPYALDVARRERRLRDGALVLMAAFGGGFTWGGALVEWGPADA